MTYNELSEKELREEQKKIEARLNEIKLEKAKRLRKKREYHLTNIEKTYHVNYSLLYSKMTEFFKYNEEMSVSRFNEIVDYCMIEDHIDKNKIYPCPECGEHSLYVGNFGDNFYPKQKVTCSMCDFTCSAKEAYTEYDAWDNFHNWLVRNKYLDK